MKIINKYVLREHVGPLAFSLTALTSLLLLNYIAKRFGDLVGKGLAWSVIGEFFLLSLPFTVAMTLPMAVLVATLYAFSRLAAENEITALKASGISLVRLLIPVLVAATGAAGFMLFFNDQVLPRANHRLSTLQQDIARKKPTFALRSQVINEISSGKLYLKSDHIDQGTSKMKGVTIYDLSDPLRRRTVIADSGRMELVGNDLLLTLYDGHMQEVPKNNASQLQRLFYEEDRVRVPDVVNSLTRTDTTNTYKGDREMSICEMQRQFDIHHLDYDVARYNLEQVLVGAARELATGEPMPPAPVSGVPPSVGIPEGASHAGRTVVPKGYKPDSSQGLGTWYCKGMAKLKELRLPSFASSAEAAEPRDAGRGTTGTAARGRPEAALGDQRARGTQQGAQQAAQQPPDQAARSQGAQQAAGSEQQPAADSARRRKRLIMTGSSPAPAPPVTNPAPAAPNAAASPAGEDSAGAAATVATPPPANPPVVMPPPIVGAGSMLTSTTIEASRSRMLENRQTMNRYQVEIQKKFAISAACVVFVLIGAPIALRFPRGGVGLVIGVSLIVFAMYYVGLIAGESLADRALLTPFWAMWAANVILTVVGIVLLVRMGREGATSRGGDLTEFYESLRTFVGRIGRRVGLPLERRHGAA